MSNIKTTSTVPKWMYVGPGDPYINEEMNKPDAEIKTGDINCDDSLILEESLEVWVMDPETGEFSEVKFNYVHRRDLTHDEETMLKESLELNKLSLSTMQKVFNS